jgi:transcriptional regulator with PAS, ATPase and Fis domain
MVRRVASLSATVLILGESGTGQELLARLLHRESESPDGPFFAVNLAAIPQELVESVLFGHEKGSFTGAVRQQIGKFELAGGGTLLLDEIGDLKLDLQAKLLRAIQEGEIERIGSQRPIKANFRLIAATNVDLDKAVKEGRFRDDLFYRINVIPVKLPPLRERIDDLPELARFFLRRYNTKFRKQVEGISDRALRMLASYWWPGNIRELENLIERLVAISEKSWITEDDLPFEFRMANSTARPQGRACSRKRWWPSAEPARAGPRKERLERDGDGGTWACRSAR